MKLIYFWVLVALISLSTAQAKKIDSYEKSSLHYFDGVYVLDLHGTREEMMFAHGYFASKNVKENSPLEFFANVMDKALADKMNSWGVSIVSRTLDVLLKMNLSDEDDKAYRAFAKGMGVPADKVFKALYYPDFGEMLASISFGKTKTFMDVPELGCSTFVVPKSSVNAGILFGRNLEFGGVGYFDRYPAVVYLHSSDPQDQPYIQMTALGIPGTHTSYNKSGMMFSLHQLTANQINPVGDLILNVMDELSRRARTLAEARALIESKKFTTPWKMIIASETEGSGFVVEVSPKGKYFFDMPTTGIGESNHVSAKEIKEDEFFATYNYLQSSVIRKAALHKALKAKSVVDVNPAIDLLGNRNHPVTSENSFIALSKFSNIMSVLMSEKEQKLFFGVARKINTKPSSDIYLQLPLSFGTDFSTYLPAITKPGVVYSAAVLEVDNQIRAAMLENSKNADLSIVAEHLRKAFELHGTDPNLNNVYAATLLKLYAVNEGKSEHYLTDAQNVLDRSKALVKGDHEKAVHSVLMARIHALKNNQNEAMQFYSRIAATTNRMKGTVEGDLSALKSDDFRKAILEKAGKTRVSLTDLDIVEF
jgi:hypothetical protein